MKTNPRGIHVGDREDHYITSSEKQEPNHFTHIYIEWLIVLTVLWSPGDRQQSCAQTHSIQAELSSTVRLALLSRLTCKVVVPYVEFFQVDEFAHAGGDRTCMRGEHRISECQR